MSRAPKLKRANGRNENVKRQRGWSDDGWGDPPKRHHCDITRCSRMTDRRVEKRDETDSEKKQNEMSVVHVDLSRRNFASCAVAISQVRNLRHIMTSHFRFGILALTWLVTSTHAVAEPRTAASGHTNRLAQEKSPYLLQHAHNPVDWYPWGEEAFAKARREHKPIFLSVGYSTCHWCHVMAHESFESEEVAAIMNREFVNIKVDREERPDVDRVYMTFVQATTGGGGWPMSGWLTPGLKPFVCGTYFPPEGRYGQPGFKKVLEKIAAAWKENHEMNAKQGAKIVDALRESQSAIPTAAEKIDLKVFDTAYGQLSSTFDAQDGGFGSAPKFPRPVTLNFLSRFYARAP